MYFGSRISILSEFRPETALLLGRMTTAPTRLRAQQINTLIASLIVIDFWQRLDTFYITAAADAQAAKLNWCGNPVYDLVATNSPAFSANLGFTGDGVTSYLASNFNPTTAAGQFSLNSANMGVWLNVNQQQLTGVIGNTSNGGCYIIPRDTSNIMSYRLSQGSASAPANSNSKGYLVINRTGVNSTQAFANAVSLGTTSIASTTLSNAGIDVCRASATSFSTNQVAAAHWGRALTPALVAAAYTRLLAYMLAVGNT